jgi:hypothetical protein
VSRFRHWFGRKHGWKTKGYEEYPDDRFFKEEGLINIHDMVPKYSRAKSSKVVVKAGCGKIACPV